MFEMDEKEKPDRLKLGHRERELLCKVIDTSNNELVIMSYVNTKTDAHLSDETIRHFLTQAFLVLKDGVTHDGNFDAFGTLVKRELQLYHEYDTLSDGLQQLAEESSQRIHRLKMDSEQLDRELQHKNSTLKDQRDELKALKAKNEEEFDFSKKWFQAQIEENVLRRQIEEKNFNHQIERILSDIKMEGKVHDSVLRYYDHEILKIKSLITHWEERFEDIDRRENELEILKNHRNNQSTELKYFETLYFKQTSEMNEYLSDKERRRQEYEYEQFRHRNAIKIQAWWRGVRVRRGLGQFKYILKAIAVKKRKMSLKKRDRKLKLLHKT